MRKLIMAGTAAFALAGFAFVGSANAQSQCVWTGYGWSCPQTYYYAPGYYAPYATPNSYYRNSYYPGSYPYPGPKVGGNR